MPMDTSFAVIEPVGKSGRGFQRMPEGVAKIEQRPIAGLALVARHDLRLHPATDGDGMFPRGPAIKHIAPVALQPGEEIGITDQAVFRHFGIASPHDACRQRIEQSGIGHDQDRLVKRTDQILAMA